MSLEVWYINVIIMLYISINNSMYFVSLFAEGLHLQRLYTLVYRSLFFTKVWYRINHVLYSYNAHQIYILYINNWLVYLIYCIFQRTDIYCLSFRGLPLRHFHYRAAKSNLVADKHTFYTCMRSNICVYFVWNKFCDFNIYLYILIERDRNIW